MTSPKVPTWPCEAYGPAGLEYGAVCFMSGQLHRRVCGDPAVCAREMWSYRRRVWDRLTAMAVTDTEFGTIARELLAEVDSADDILRPAED